MDGDYELALRLQKEFDNENTPSQSSFKSKVFTTDTSDLDLAYRLQAEYDAEVKDDSEDCVLVSAENIPIKNSQLKKPLSSEDADLALALQLQAEWAESGKNEANLSPQKSVAKTQVGSGSIVDASWELVDPCPDIHALFLEFNASYFWGKLEGVEVRWSPRMTLCAGLCVYEGRGGLCSVRLSKPLLKLRPRKDLVETLLHEMIHAYLFITQNNKDHDGHGPEFHKHMYRINSLTGTKISVYHSFHQEVALYKTHWWRCSGVCRERKPFYGWVKRSMNRAPSPRDLWWPQHQQTCGGTFVKVQSPEPTTTAATATAKGQTAVKKRSKDETREREKEKKTSGMQDIRKLFSPQPKKPKTNETSELSVPLSDKLFPGKGFVLGKT